jgi:AcrR family transcriptional regulator
MSSQVKEAKRPAPGRPRDLEARTRILAAANTLLDEKGFRATTIESIAERAGTSKVTIYRWWSCKASILLEAFLEQMSAQVPQRETASALSDLKEQMCAFAEVLRGRPGTVLAGLLAESMLDPEAGRAYLEHWITPRRREARRILERAVANHELGAHVDLEVMIDALFGPIYLRVMQRHAPPSREFAASVWDAVVQRTR